MSYRRPSLSPSRNVPAVHAGQCCDLKRVSHKSILSVVAVANLWGAKANHRRLKTGF